MTALEWILLLLFWLLLAAAAIGDLRRLRISNGMAVATLAAAIVLLLFVRDGAGPWWQHLASFAIMLGAGFILFSAGWFGGGDAKFAAAAAALFNLGELVWFIAATALAGGLLAILSILVRLFSRLEGERGLGRARRQPIPYGVAIALGAIIVSARLIAFPS